MKDMLIVVFILVDVFDIEFLEKFKKEMNYFFVCGLRIGFVLKCFGLIIFVYRNVLFGRVLFICIII